MIARLRGLTPKTAICRASMALCFGLAATSATAMAETTPGPAGPMYEPGAVVAIDLTLPEASIEALKGESDEYQPGTFSLASSDGTPAGVGDASEPIEIGIRLKGQASFRTLAGKAAFKIKFNEFVSGQKFLGLKKMTLNNMVQDPSMIHEALAYEAFRSVGVAAPRTGHAYVRVNGADYGLYLNVETLDDVALKRWVDSTAHLYEGSYGSDLTVGGAGAFEIDEGDEEDRGDLEALIAAVNDAQGDWSDAMAGVADLQQMVRMWAVERYIGHWDSYTGIPGDLWPNNFYLHSDDAGLFSMFPWGTDQAWNERLAFDGEGGLMFAHCLADASCASMYEEALAEAAAAITALDLDSLAADLTPQLAPWQQMDPRREHSLAQIAEGVEATRAFIATRPAELTAWLDRPRAEQPAELPQPSAQPIGQPARQTMRVGRSVVVGGVLITRLNLPGAGKVSQRASINTAGGAVGVCFVRAEVKEPGASTLRCQLPANIRQRLRTRWLRLKVDTQFTPQDAGPESISRTVAARRSAPR